MRFFKRIVLFLVLNLAVIIVLSTAVTVFGLESYLTPYGLNLQALLIWSAIIGFAGSFISLFLSKKMVKWTMGVQVIDTPRDNAEAKLVQTIQSISSQLGISMPEVGIYPSAEVNAFATGWSKNHSLVAVSEGLLQEMNDAEVEGVLAHEMAHVANGDMVTMTLLQGVLNTFVIFFARAAAYAVQVATGRDNSSIGGLAYLGLSILFEILFGILASVILMAYSRRREYAADRGGAMYVGKAKMIAALKRLQQMTAKIDTSQKSMATMKISDKRSGFGMLFSSHPRLEDRIEALQKAPIG